MKHLIQTLIAVFMALVSIPKGGGMTPPSFSVQLNFELIDRTPTIEPNLTEFSMPPYNTEIMRAGISDKVSLEIDLDEYGRVTSVRATASKVKELAAEAEVTARSWRFLPARIGGKAVPCKIGCTIQYKVSEE